MCNIGDFNAIEFNIITGIKNIFIILTFLRPNFCSVAGVFPVQTRVISVIIKM